MVCKQKRLADKFWLLHHLRGYAIHQILKYQSQPITLNPTAEWGGGELWKPPLAEMVFTPKRMHLLI